MTETTTPLQPTTVEPTKLQPTTPAQPNAPTAPDSPHVTETPSPDHLLTLTDLTRQFVRRGTPFDAVSHVNLTVAAGEFIAIVGRSGNGKSTLINMVAGLIRPTSGTVSVAGRNVADLGDKALSVLRNRTIGFVTHRARQRDSARNDVSGAAAVRPKRRSNGCRGASRCHQ